MRAVLELLPLPRTREGPQTDSVSAVDSHFAYDLAQDDTVSEICEVFNDALLLAGGRVDVAEGGEVERVDPDDQRRRQFG